jgi:hypothetical protein
MNHLRLSASVLLATAFVTGCGSPRSVTVAPGSQLTVPAPSAPSAPEQPTFTVAVQNPATVAAPPACPTTCIGEGYDGLVSLPVQLTSDGFIGRVSLIVSKIPAGLFGPDPPAPVALNYADAPSAVVTNIPLFAMPGLAPGSYAFTLTAAPLPGSNSTAPVQIPVTLTVVSGASAAWQGGK